MAALTNQSLARTGLTPSFTACAGGGDTFVNDGRTFLRVKNGSGSPITVTVTPQQLVDGLAVTPRTVSIPATTGDVSFGPFGPEYNDTNNIAYITYSGVTTLTIAVISMPRV